MNSQAKLWFLNYLKYWCFAIKILCGAFVAKYEQYFVRLRLRFYHYSENYIAVYLHNLKGPHWPSGE